MKPQVNKKYKILALFIAISMIFGLIAVPVNILGTSPHISEPCEVGDCHTNYRDSQFYRWRMPVNAIHLPLLPVVTPAPIHFRDIEVLLAIQEQNLSLPQIPNIPIITPAGLNLSTINPINSPTFDVYLQNDNNGVFRIVSINAQGLTGTLDLRGLTYLRYASFTDGNITGVTLGNNPALVMLELSGNSLTSLNILGTQNLQWLCVSNNQLTSITFGNIANLRVLALGNNNLQNLNINVNNLDWLILKNNSLLSLPVGIDNVNRIDITNALAPPPWPTPTPIPTTPEDDDENDNQSDIDAQSSENDNDQGEDEDDNFTLPRGIPSGVNPLNPREVLEYVEDPETASDAIRNALRVFRERFVDAPSETGLEYAFINNFTEHVISQIATRHIIRDNYSENNENWQDEPIILSFDTTIDLRDMAFAAHDAIMEMFVYEEHALNRHINIGVTVVTDLSDITVLVDPTLIGMGIDQFTISTPFYSVTFPRSFVENNAEEDPIVVSITVNGLEAEQGAITNLSTDLNQRSYSVSFSRPVADPIRLSVEPIYGDRDTQTLMAECGEIIGGRYNPVTNMLDARISRDETYVVISNVVNFDDILNRSAEMQTAIRVLASQGIVNGMTPTEFRPDDPIDRAATAAIFMRTLSRLDPNANAGFADVLPTDWFFGAAGSASRIGLMHGTGDNMFSPHVQLTREQLIALAARTLRTEMRYHDPSDPMRYLQRYADVDNISDWSVNDIALATRENMVIRRADGQFRPSEPITRGEAAIILHRLYLRIW